jgi:hypothetical protein
MSQASAKHLTPAELVIARLTAREIALHLRITPSGVYRWTYDKPNGRGGFIPSRYHQDLMVLAKDLGRELTFEELSIGGPAIPAVAA